LTGIASAWALMNLPEMLQAYWSGLSRPHNPDGACALPGSPQLIADVRACRTGDS